MSLAATIAALKRELAEAADVASVHTPSYRTDIWSNIRRWRAMAEPGWVAQEDEEDARHVVALIKELNAS